MSTSMSAKPTAVTDALIAEMETTVEGMFEFQEGGAERFEDALFSEVQRTDVQLVFREALAAGILLESNQRSRHAPQLIRRCLENVSSRILRMAAEAKAMQAGRQGSQDTAGEAIASPQASSLWK